MTFLPLDRRVVARTLAISLLLFAGKATAQETPAVSASLLRVLGEVADAYRTGKPIYLVADYSFPHRVIGRFESLPPAQKLQTDSGSTFGVFGPYVTPADDPPQGASQIESVIIRYRTPQGLKTRKLDKAVDALFLTMSAVDKFMIPYYSRVYGPKYGDDLRGLIIVRGGGKPCHIRTTPCFPKPDGTIEVLRVPDPVAQPSPLRP